MARLVFAGVLLVFLASFALGSVEFIHPGNASVQGGSSFDAGFVSPGQTFELVFSDNSGSNFEWDSLKANESSFPKNWIIV